MLVVGFHRRKLSFRGKAYAWMEFTLYTPSNGVGWSVYPKVRIPGRWA